MSPEERRRALIDTTRPLLIEHGSAVSTRQIAEAAGVAEGTIFRVFASKEDLIHACIVDSITADALATQLAALPASPDLGTTVVDVVRVLAERITGIRTLVGLLHDQGRHAFHQPPSPADAAASPRCDRPDPSLIRAQVADAVATALSRHADALRMPPRAAASALVALTFGATHTFSGASDVADPAAIADLLLHGISKEA